MKVSRHYRVRGTKINATSEKFHPKVNELQSEHFSFRIAKHDDKSSNKERS